MSNQIPQWAEGAFDSIDAGVFSGDTFQSAEGLGRMRYYIGRWQRELFPAAKAVDVLPLVAEEAVVVATIEVMDYEKGETYINPTSAGVKLTVDDACTDDRLMRALQHDRIVEAHTLAIAQRDTAIAELRELSVTNLMLEVVPGRDGMGEEIYAKSVGDVNDAFYKLVEKIEALEDQNVTLQTELKHKKSLDQQGLEFRQELSAQRDTALAALMRVRDWVKNRRGQPEKLANTGQTHTMIEKHETLDMLDWAVEQADWSKQADAGHRDEDYRPEELGDPAGQPPCQHEWTDDGQFLLVCTACGAQEDHDPHWRPIETAPRDGSMLRLLVEFSEHSTEDEDQAPTIGANNFDNDEEDVWKFAGWCWSHDHFVQGEGVPVGWLPLLDVPVQVKP